MFYMSRILEHPRVYIKVVFIAYEPLLKVGLTLPVDYSLETQPGIMLTPLDSGAFSARL